MADETIKIEPFDEDIQRQRRKNTVIFILLAVLVIIAAITTALLINKYVITSYEVRGSSMYPTLIGTDNDQIEDRIYLNTQTQKFKRGDIIVFVAHPDIDPDTCYVKRIIGVPGDKIEFKSGKVYRNDEELVEDYVNSNETPSYMEDFSITVPDNSYFVMGDNRNHSSDSRTNWEENSHCIKKDAIVGKAFLIKKSSGKLKWI